MILNIDNVPPNELEDASEENCISNPHWIFRKLHQAYDNHSIDKSCKFKDLKLIATTRQRLRNTLIFVCTKCNKEVKINCSDEDTKLDLNIATLLGSENIGIGLSQLEELLSIARIRCMGSKTWQRKRAAVPVFIIKANEEMSKGVS